MPRSWIAALFALAVSTVAAAQTTCPANAATAILAPDGPGLTGMTRLQTFDYLVGVWFIPGRYVIQYATCPNGDCLWVPWHRNSDRCGYDDLHSECGVTPDGSYMISCQVTDELSQVGMALAMSDRQDDFARWVVTVRYLMTGSGSAEVPSWKASRNYAAFTIPEPSDAPDATARIITALYIAASSDRFTDTAAKASYRTLADSLAHAFINADFATRTFTPPGGATITHWLGIGSVDTSFHADLNLMQSFGGYYGDAVIALLAAYQSTGESVFLDYARDTVNAYLFAADYDGSRFTVAPEHFTWHVDANGVVSHDAGTNWTADDAARAVSLCKAMYLASLNRVDLGPRLATYCSQWLQSGGVKEDGYSRVYHADGTPAEVVQGGFHENGLGASLHFALATPYLLSKLNEAINGHYATQTQSFDWTECMGIYRPAFVIVNLGSAIGLDAKAFTRRVCAGSPSASPAVGFLNGCGTVLDPFLYSGESARRLFFNGVAFDEARVTQVTYSLSGATFDHGTATGTASWSFRPVTLNRGITAVHVDVQDDAGNSGSADCSIAIGIKAEAGRRRVVGGH